MPHWLSIWLYTFFLLGFLAFLVCIFFVFCSIVKSQCCIQRLKRRGKHYHWGPGILVQLKQDTAVSHKHTHTYSHQQFNHSSGNIRKFKKWYLALSFSSKIDLMINLRNDLSSFPLLLPSLAPAHGVHISGLHSSSASLSFPCFTNPI